VLEESTQYLEEPEELRCPRCFRKDIAVSLQDGIVDELMQRWGRVPRQCRFCGKRFYVRESDLAEDPEEQDPED